MKNVAKVMFPNAKAYQKCVDTGHFDYRYLRAVLVGSRGRELKCEEVRTKSWA